MLKQHKKTLILTSVITLLPILAGVLLWNHLPAQLITHWGVSGEADGWSGKAFAVFALPLILLAFHWLCVLITAKDSRTRGQNAKVFGLVLWSIPVVSLFSSGIMYATAMDVKLQMGAITMLPMGALFIVIGNYLPKCRPNRTIGIKVKWTFESEENWNATHRMAGRLWVAGGILFLLCAFLPLSAMMAVMVINIAVMVVIPVGYSYAFRKKQEKAGTLNATLQTKSKAEQRTGKIALVATVLILAGCAVLIFTGNIAVAFGKDAFTVEATYWPDLTVEYGEVDRVEYRETDSPGVRTYGFGSARLLMGNFHNEEFGAYTRYSYTGKGPCIVVTSGEKILVLGGKTAEETESIYWTLMERIS